MTTKNIEVEVRGLLATIEYNKLKSFLSKNGTFQKKRERVLIDYSKGIATRTKDIRIRETNGIPEIIIKLGSWGGSENREEISIVAEKSSFDTLVKAFGELGFVKGMLCVRNSLVYHYQGVELALIEVPRHSYYFEAEILAAPANVKLAKEKLKKICAELRLKVFSDKDLYAYVARLNEESNTVFEYKNYKDGYFREKKYLKNYKVSKVKISRR